MRSENLFNPCCPRCQHRLRRNGYVKIKHHFDKPRFRCSSCGYSETQNSIAHNRNRRTYPTNLCVNKAKALAMSNTELTIWSSTEHARPHVES